MGDALDKAIRLVGGPKVVAGCFGLKSTMAISQWKKRGVPAEHVLKLSALTRWSVSPHELAPHLYPHPDDGMPDSMRSGA